MSHASRMAPVQAPREQAAPEQRTAKGISRECPAGNQALLRRLQAKLAVGAVNDPLEHEADAVADRVMRMADPGAVSRGAPPRISRKCAACEGDEKQTVRTKRDGTDTGESEAPDTVQDALSSPGRPLDPQTRAFFEPRFGRDLGDVRIHTGAAADRSARDVNAQAFTVGRDVVFGAGRFAPSTQAGRHLLAHELTHVAQQDGAPATAVRRDTNQDADAENGDSGKGGGGGKKPAVKAPAGICGKGSAKSVVTMGNATFAMCDLTDLSRLDYAAAVEHPNPAGEDVVGTVEMRALELALFGYVGYDLPAPPKGSTEPVDGGSEMDWQHGFIQTIRSLKYTANYQRGWSSTREVTTPRRDASGAGVPAPWYSNQSMPSYSIMIGKQIKTVSGPIAFGPEFIGTDPVGVLDTPQSTFYETVPADQYPVCPCSWMESVRAQGEIDTWLVVTRAGKGQVESDLGFLQHITTTFDLKAEKASNYAVQGKPTMTFEDGRGKNSPVLGGALANDDLMKEKIVEGQPCPVTIPQVKCPVQSPKSAPKQ